MAVVYEVWRPVVENLDSPDMHVPFLDVNPCVGDFGHGLQAGRAQQQPGGDEVAVGKCGCGVAYPSGRDIFPECGHKVLDWHG